MSTRRRAIGKWVGATIAAAAITLLSWGLAGAIDLGCHSSRRGACGVPDGGEAYFAAMMISPWAFAVVGKKVIRTDDWRPSLGLSAGALAGVVITLSTGMTAGFWVEVLILLALGAGIPVLLWAKVDGRR